MSGDRSVEPAQGEAAPAAPKKKKSEAQPFLIAVGITLGIGIIIFAILMATVFRGSFSKKDDTDQSSLNASVTESTSTETIVVPDFKNLSYEAISKNPVWDGKFTFKTKYEYSDTVNEGYVIIESVTVGNARFVIGENPNNQAAPYVTWQANVKNDPNNFFWGHYCATKLDAVADFAQRINAEAEYLRERTKANTAPLQERKERGETR